MRFTTCLVSQDERRHDRPVTLLTELREQYQLSNLNWSNLNCAVDKVLQKRFDLTLINEHVDFITGGHCTSLPAAILNKDSAAVGAMMEKVFDQFLFCQRSLIENELEQNPQLIDEVLNNG